MNDEDLATVADSSFGQYFLVSPEKLSLIFQAAGIGPNDRVLEIGAGAGTVARSVPECRSLTVVELDSRLHPYLQGNVPNARIVQGDGLRIVREVEFDVLLSNMPNGVTESLIDILPELPFRTAVMAVGRHSRVDQLPKDFEVTEVTTTTGDDFKPHMPSTSRIVRVSRR